MGNKEWRMMRKVLTVLLVLVSLAAMTATVAYADGRPMLNIFSKTR
jgi:hypothetical protein